MLLLSPAMPVLVPYRINAFKPFGGNGKTFTERMLMLMSVHSTYLRVRIKCLKDIFIALIQIRELINISNGIYSHQCSSIP